MHRFLSTFLTAESLCVVVSILRTNSARLEISALEKAKAEKTVCGCLKLILISWVVKKEKGVQMCVSKNKAVILL